jgi:hypothetical protein
MIDDKQFEIISHKAVQVLGSDRVDRMSDPQVNLLNAALDRLVEKRGSASNVTPAEIEGQYEQIMSLALPTGLNV